MNQIDSEEAEDPKTCYRYSHFKQKIKELRNQEKQLNKYRMEANVQKSNGGLLCIERLKGGKSSLTQPHTPDRKVSNRSISMQRSVMPSTKQMH